MNKFFLIIIIFFFTSCASSSVKNDFNFTDDMSFEQFEIMLEDYTNNNPYPKADD